MFNFSTNNIFLININDIYEELFNLSLFKQRCINFYRYTQAPEDLWSWYEEYLDDEEVSKYKGGEHFFGNELSKL